MADTGLGALSDFITGLAGKIPGQYDAMSSGISNAVAGSRQADDQFIGKLNDLQTQGNQSPGLAFASGVMGNGWLTKGMGEGLANYNTALTQQRAEQLDRAGKIQALQIAKANLDRAAAGEQLANTKDALSMPNNVVGGMQGVGNLNWLSGISGSGLPQTKMQSAAPPVLGASGSLGAVANGASDGSNASQPTGQQSPSQDLSNPVQPSQTANAPISMADSQNPMPAQVSGQMPPQSAVPIGQGQQGSAQQGQQGQPYGLDTKALFAQDLATLKAYQADFKQNPQHMKAPIAMELYNTVYNRVMAGPVGKGLNADAEAWAKVNPAIAQKAGESAAEARNKMGEVIPDVNNPGMFIRPTVLQEADAATANNGQTPPKSNQPPVISVGQSPSSDQSQELSPSSANPKPSFGVSAVNPNSAKYVDTQIEEHKQALSAAISASVEKQQALQMRNRLVDSNGNPLVNSGPSGAFINHLAAIAKQAGFSDETIQGILKTNPENDQEANKLRVALAMEYGKQTMSGDGKDVALRQQTAKAFLDSMPNNQLLNGASKWIIDNSIVPQSDAIIGAGDIARKLNPLTDNVQGALYDYKRSHPFFISPLTPGLAPQTNAPGTPMSMGDVKTTTTPAAVIAPKYQEGQTATGPNGAKMMFKSGKWVTNQ